MRTLRLATIALVVCGCSSAPATTTFPQPTAQVIYVTPSPVAQPTPLVVYVTPGPVSVPTPIVIFVTPRPTPVSTTMPVPPATGSPLATPSPSTSQQCVAGYDLYHCDWSDCGKGCRTVIVTPQYDCSEGLSIFATVYDKDGVVVDDAQDSASSVPVGAKARLKLEWFTRSGTDVAITRVVCWRDGSNYFTP